MSELVVYEKGSVVVSDHRVSFGAISYIPSSIRGATVVERRADRLPAIPLLLVSLLCLNLSHYHAEHMLYFWAFAVCLAGSVATWYLPRRRHIVRIQTATGTYDVLVTTDAEHASHIVQALGKVAVPGPA